MKFIVPVRRVVNCSAEWYLFIPLFPDEMWVAEIEALLAKAKIEARNKALPPAVSSYVFYGSH